MLKISNKNARHIAIVSSGLNKTPSIKCGSQELLNLVKRLGYVQQDPIQVVARAHDHILWSRNRGYQVGQLDALLKNERSVFEHFSHDACVLPLDSFPYWSIQYKRKAELKQFKVTGNLLSNKEQKQLLARITDEGPLCSRDFKVSEPSKKSERAIWSKPAHKRTLDYLWLKGVLAVSKREKFTKYYDLAERVFPASVFEQSKKDKDCIEWLASHAMDCLGFGTYSEIKGFWDAFTLHETKWWREKNQMSVLDVTVETFEGDFKNTLARKAVVSNTESDYPLSKRIRILNPFDPLIRDRKRLLYLFGFDYRIEMYVPQTLRQYGYYVYPLLEYDTFIGRIEIRHDRKKNILFVDNLWPETTIKFGKQRMNKLNSELERMRKFCLASRVQWSQ